MNARRRPEGDKLVKDLENQTFSSEAATWCRLFRMVFVQVRSEFEKPGAPLTPFMCGVSRLWQRLDKLAEEAERERSEKEELRRANHLLQQRVEELSRGASSVPLAERVKPIVAPSPPKSLKGFRQVRRSVGRWRDGEDVSGII